MRKIRARTLAYQPIKIPSRLSGKLKTGGLRTAPKNFRPMIFRQNEFKLFCRKIILPENPSEFHSKVTLLIAQPGQTGTKLWTQQIERSQNEIIPKFHFARVHFCGQEYLLFIPPEFCILLSPTLTPDPG
jgi:hypothetical protein